MTVPAIAITSGEPAGIGPELVAMLAARHRDRPWPARFVVFIQTVLPSKAIDCGSVERFFFSRNSVTVPAGVA